MATNEGHGTEECHQQAKQKLCLLRNQAVRHMKKQAASPASWTREEHFPGVSRSHNGAELDGDEEDNKICLATHIRYGAVLGTAAEEH